MAEGTMSPYDLIRQLMILRQSFSVRAYIDQFNEIQTRVNLTEPFTIGCFLTGLRPDIADRVRQPYPASLQQAFTLALLADISINLEQMETICSRSLQTFRTHEVDSSVATYFEHNDGDEILNDVVKAEATPEQLDGVESDEIDSEDDAPSSDVSALLLDEEYTTADADEAESAVINNGSNGVLESATGSKLDKIAEISIIDIHSSDDESKSAVTSALVEGAGREVSEIAEDAAHNSEAIPELLDGFSDAAQAFNAGHNDLQPQEVVVVPVPPPTYHFGLVSPCFLDPFLASHSRRLAILVRSFGFHRVLCPVVANLLHYFGKFGEIHDAFKVFDISPHSSLMFGHVSVLGNFIMLRFILVYLLNCCLGWKMKRKTYWCCSVLRTFIVLESEPQDLQMAIIERAMMAVTWIYKGLAHARVRVAVRLRPRNAEEIVAHAHFAASVEFQPELKGVQLRRNNRVIYTYERAEVLSKFASQKGAYEVVAKPVVPSVLDGINGTLLAYGQIGTRKTHALRQLRADYTADQGIMVCAVEDILAEKSPDTDSVCVSYFQLYMDQKSFWELLQLRAAVHFVANTKVNPQSRIVIPFSWYIFIGLSTDNIRVFPMDMLTWFASESATVGSSIVVRKKIDVAETLGCTTLVIDIDEICRLVADHGDDAYSFCVVLATVAREHFGSGLTISLLIAGVREEFAWLIAWALMLEYGYLPVSVMLEKSR